METAVQHSACAGRGLLQAAVPQCGEKLSLAKINPGDTLSLLATGCNYPLLQLEAVNPQIPNPDLIVVGQCLCLPSDCATTKGKLGFTYYGSRCYICSSKDKLPEALVLK